MTESQVDGLKKYNFGVLGSKCHTLYKLVDLWSGAGPGYEVLVFKILKAKVF